MSISFKRLTRGVKFDDARFVNDAVKLQLRPSAVPHRLPKEIEKENEVTETKPSTHLSKKRKRAAIGDGEDLNIFSSGTLNEGKNKQKSSSKDNGDFKSDANGSKKKKRKIDSLRHKEKVNRIRNVHRIHIWGEDLADPIESFHLIPNITDRILRNISSMHFESPTPIQMQAIPIMLSGRELLACAPTGSGKTAAFLLPLIIQLLSKPEKVGFRAVLLSPTRELAKQTYRDCVRLSEGTGLLTFMINKKDIAKHKFKNLTNCDILISTPNRLIHLLKQETISLSRVEHLVVDECDHLFEIGFRDQLGFIYSACDSVDIKRAFFSATCAFEVEQFCKTNLNNAVVLAIGAKNSAVDLVKQELIFTGTEAGKLMAFRSLVEKGIEPPMLVFVQNQERCDELFTELTYLSVPCGIIHSGKSQTQREKIIDSFREGNIWVLICTALLSRGMDFPAVKIVVNFDLPISHIQYIHSIGRTGRAGKIGQAITFFTEDDKENLRRIAQVLENSGFPTPPYMLKLKKSRRDKNKKAQVPSDRQSLSRMSGYDYSKKKRLLQIIKQSADKKHDRPLENGDKKVGKKLKNLEKQLDKEKKCRSIEKKSLKKRNPNSKKVKLQTNNTEKKGVSTKPTNSKPKTMKTRSPKKK